MISSTKIVHHARPCARSILGRLSYTDVEDRALARAKLVGKCVDGKSNHAINILRALRKPE